MTCFFNTTAQPWHMAVLGTSQNSHSVGRLYRFGAHALARDRLGTKDVTKGG